MDDSSQAGSPPQTPQPERGLVCPQCGCRHFRTTHTEPLRNGRIRRRKVCRHCGRRMLTYELPHYMVRPDRYI